MDERPVIFLDSGIGGIPYAHSFHSRNRDEKLVYVADRANFPYGPKSKETLTRLLVSLVKELTLRYEPKILTVACNAASVSALNAIRDNFPGLPVVGTVPAIKPAVMRSRKRCAGVLGTQRTVEDPYIDELAAKFGPDCRIVREAAPELVEFAEHRWFTADREERLRAVKPWTEKFLAMGADTLVLSCTHFLLLKEEFMICGSDKLEIFDSVEGVVRRVESILDCAGVRSASAGGAGVPVVKITGDCAPEPHWEQLASSFGFTLEKNS